MIQPISWLSRIGQSNFSHNLRFAPKKDFGLQQQTPKSLKRECVQNLVIGNAKKLLDVTGI